VLLTWPARYFIRTIRYRKVSARSRVKKVVVLGLDGLDHSLINKFLDEGKLPNFAKLKDTGCFKPLASTVPPISPVAWSTFQTGSNPGKHNIFDFLTRDKKNLRAHFKFDLNKGAVTVYRSGKIQDSPGKG